jgi:hypothetical protein
MTTLLGGQDLPRPAAAPDAGPLDDRLYDLVEARVICHVLQPRKDRFRERWFDRREDGVQPTGSAVLTDAARCDLPLMLANVCHRCDK